MQRDADFFHERATYEGIQLFIKAFTKRFSHFSFFGTYIPVRATNHYTATTNSNYLCSRLP